MRSPSRAAGSKSLVPSRCPLITKTAETAIASVERAIAYRFPPNWWAIYPVRATAALPASAGIRRSTNKRRSQKLREQPGDGRNERRHVYIAPRHVPAAGVVVKLVAKDAVTIRREQVEKQAQAYDQRHNREWGWHTNARNFGAFEESWCSENSFGHAVSSKHCLSKSYAIGAAESSRVLTICIRFWRIVAFLSD